MYVYVLLFWRGSAHSALPPPQGTSDNPGINQRALQLLFSEVQDKASDWEYTITVSAAEIYNELLRWAQAPRRAMGSDSLGRVSIQSVALTPRKEIWCSGGRVREGGAPGPTLDADSVSGDE